MSGNCRNFSISAAGSFVAGDDVDDVDRLFPTSQRSGHTHFTDPIDCFEIIDYLIRRAPGVMKMQTALWFLYRSRELRQQALFGLWSKSFQRFADCPASAAAFSSAIEVMPSLVLKLSDLFDTQSGNC